MEKLKKSYVEKRYKEKAEISEVMERDPMKIQNDGEICAFRFFDKEINANGEEKYDGEKSNFSKWIFFGKRMMLRELENSYGTNPDWLIIWIAIILNLYVIHRVILSL